MSVAMITALTLGQMPELLAQECGERALNRVFSRSDLSPCLRYDKNHFIPQASLKSFVAEGSRELGERDLGLIAAPELSILDYGLWGNYVLSAPTLGDSMNRARSALCYHSTFDSLRFVPQGQDIRFIYRFAESFGRTYENVAFVAVAVMLSLVRAYIGQSWHPGWIELNIQKRRGCSALEQAFQSQVRLGADAVAFPVPAHCLKFRRQINRGSPSLADVHRDRRGRSPRGLVEVVQSITRVQILDQQPDLDSTARQLGFGPRTLQRQLERRGITFRELAQSVKLLRAKELLQEPDLTIAHISAELFYSTPANFARAFRSNTGMSPRQYRRHLTAHSGADQSTRRIVAFPPIG